MPSISKIELDKLKDNYQNYSFFIETGTYVGETIFNMEPYFNKLYTIEYSNDLFNSVKNKYNGNKIDFILGDSSIIFETLLPTINQNTIFFLDGHWSSGNTGRSAKDCPLIEEITHINNLFQHKAIIIIDDYRLFGLNNLNSNQNEDWSDITKDKLLNILEKRIENVYHLDSVYSNDDRLIIHINKKD